MFWKSKVGKEKKKPIKRQPKTLKEICGEAFRKELEKDPTLMKKVAFKEMGHAELIEDTNPIELKKQEIKTKIIDRALQKIQEDPELAEQFVDTQISEIMGEGRRESKYEGYESPGSAIRQALEELEDVEEFRDRLGIKPREGGLLKSIVTEENVGEFIKLLRGLVVKAPIEESTVIVRIDGQLKRIPESQFRQLEQAGRITPVAAIEAPKPLPPTEQLLIEPTQLETKEPEVPEFVLNNLEIFASYLELTSEEFVEELSGLKDTDSTYQLLWTFLSSTTPEAVIKFIEPYSKHSQVGACVRKLLSEEGKVWLGQVISIIKEKNE